MRLACTVAKVCLLLLLCAPSGAGTQQSGRDASDELVPRSELFAPRERWDVTVSPDGRYIAHIARENHKPQIFVAALDDPTNHIWSSEFPDGIVSYRWSFSDHTIIGVRNHDSGRGRSIASIDFSSGRVLDVTERAGIEPRIEAISTRHPDRAVISINDRHPGMHDYYECDLRTGERRPLLKNNGFAAVFFDGALKPRVATRVLSSGRIRVSMNGGSAWDRLFEVEPHDLLTSRLLGVTFDGRQIVMLDGRGRSTVGLATIDIASGVQRVHAADPMADIHEVLLDQMTGTPIAAASTYAKRFWHPLRDDTGQTFARIAAYTSDDVSVVSRSLDEGIWIIRIASSTAPARYAVVTRTTIDDLFTERTLEASADRSGAHIHPHDS